jgi:hypothetical protein
MQDDWLTFPIVIWHRSTTQRRRTRASQFMRVCSDFVTGKTITEVMKDPFDFEPKPPTVVLVVVHVTVRARVRSSRASHRRRLPLTLADPSQPLSSPNKTLVGTTMYIRPSCRLTVAIDQQDPTRFLESHFSQVLTSVSLALLFLYRLLNSILSSWNRRPCRPSPIPSLSDRP